MNKRVLLMLGVVLLLGGAIAAACSTDTDDLEARIEALEQQSGGGSSEQIAALQESVQRANMIATLNLLDGVGFHETNEAIIAGEEPPEGINGRVLAALRAVAATDWADDLDADAQAFVDDLQAFFDALANRETSDLEGASTAAHDMYHSFTGSAWTMLGEMAGVSTSAGDDHEGGDHDEGTAGEEHSEDEMADEEHTDEEGMDEEHDMEEGG